MSRQFASAFVFGMGIANLLWLLSIPPEIRTAINIGITMAILVLWVILNRP